LIRTLLYLDPRKGDYSSLVDHFRTVGILERAARHSGCHGSEIQVPIARQGPALVTALWTSPAAYDTWRNDPWRIGSSAGLDALLEPRADTEKVGGTLYRIVHSVTRAGGDAGSREDG
jgi:hypothetical protein